MIFISVFYFFKAHIEKLHFSPNTKEKKLGLQRFNQLQNNFIQ